MNRQSTKTTIVSICIVFAVTFMCINQDAFSTTKGESDRQIQSLKLPDDTSPRITVREIQISGNTSISTEQLLENMPLIFNASDQAISKADSQYLYDFRGLRDFISNPGTPREISLRTIQGLTQYILSIYQSRNYAGIYVYVPEGTIKDGKLLTDGTLPIWVIEAKISEVKIKFYDSDRKEVEKGYLRRSAVEDWSPIKTGKMANQKTLDYFVNLLNLNPDRYVSAVVSRGAEPNTLALQYDIYETSPWHYFIQVDNSGVHDRQWTPRLGVINTNLLGIDDRFVVIYQAKPDKTADENYSVIAGYDFPLFNPRLRFNLYSGYSEFDIHPESGPFNFMGSGKFYGGTLRYNTAQVKGWFFDITGTISHEESKLTPSLFPQFLESNVKMDLWGVGLDIHHRDDMSTTSIIFNRFASMGDTDRKDFVRARTAADPEFSIYTTSANHSMYLDQKKVQQLRGSLRCIWTNDRLVPAKMTAFGGMYSVRGYDEYEIIADGGLLASVQYEFDLVRHSQSLEQQESAQKRTLQKAEGLWLKKLAPLAFLDYGRAKINDPLPYENRYDNLFSIGIGNIIELGNNFVGAVYYGYPLTATHNTREGKGRVNVSFMLRY